MNIFRSIAIFLGFLGIFCFSQNCSAETASSTNTINSGRVQRSGSSWYDAIHGGGQPDALDDKVVVYANSTGWINYRGILTFALDLPAGSFSITSAKVRLWGSATKLNDSHMALYGSPDVGTLDITDYEGCFDVATSSDTVFRAGFGGNWAEADWNEFNLNADGLFDLALDEDGLISFCVKDPYFDVAEVAPSGTHYLFAEDFVNRLAQLVITYEATPEPTPTEYGSLAGAGITVNDFFSCCDGFCDYPISATPQLGWWGVGSVQDRKLYYGFDNECTGDLTNYIDFSTTTAYLLPVSDDLNFGLHEICFEYYIDDALAISETQNIQIIAGDDCIDPNIAGFDDECTAPCAGVSTSTISGGIECGFKNAACFFLHPSDQSINFLISSKEKLKTKFPANAFLSVGGAIQSALASSSDDMSGTFKLPTYNKASSSFVMIDVLDASTTEKAIGKSNATMIRNTAIWFIWLLTALYLIIRVSKR